MREASASSGTATSAPNGCGMGRFSDVASRWKATVVGGLVVPSVRVSTKPGQLQSHSPADSAPIVIGRESCRDPEAGPQTPCWSICQVEFCYSASTKSEVTCIKFGLNESWDAVDNRERVTVGAVKSSRGPLWTVPCLP